MGQPCLPSSRENLEDNSQQCFSDFEVGFDGVLGQKNELTIVSFGKPCTPSPRIHFEHLLKGSVQPFLHHFLADFSLCLGLLCDDEFMSENVRN